MKHIYLLDFGTYTSCLYCGLIFDRIGNSPIVKVTRQFGDLPFWKYFQMRFCSELGRHFQRRADIIRFEVEVTHGIGEDIVWRKRNDGMFEPYDEVADITMPYLARHSPPTKKVIRRGFVVER